MHPAGTGAKLPPTRGESPSSGRQPAAMPRRSADFFETLPHAAPSTPIPRLKPPDSMSEAARKVFCDLVIGSRADCIECPQV